MIIFKSLNKKIAFICLIVISITFCFGIIFTGLIGYLFSSKPMNEHYYMENTSQTLATIYETLGESSLKKFILQIKKKDKVDIVFSLPDNQYISSVTPPKNLMSSMQSKTLPFSFKNYYAVNNYLVYLKKTKNNLFYRIAINTHKMSNPFKMISLPIGVRFIFAFSIIGMIIYYVLQKLYSPLKIIMNGISKLSKGELGTRVGYLLDNKEDELDRLGKNFDKMATKVQTLIKAKEQVLQYTAHELRSPLARIRIATTLLEKEISKKGMCDVEVIKHESENMDKLIDEILTLERLNTYTNDLKKEPFDIKPILKSLVETANYETNKTRVSLNPIKNIIVNGNKRLLKRAIENIIRNALYHSGKKSKIVIDAQLIKNDIVISIKDNGPGIENAMLETIFDPFIRSNIKTKSAHGGYGLGLTIAKKITSLHDGKISAKNRVPNGLHVSIFLPVSIHLQSDIVL